MGKKSINVWCPAFIALKNGSSIYFDAENGFSLVPRKHKNAHHRFHPNNDSMPKDAVYYQKSTHQVTKCLPHRDVSP